VEGREYAITLAPLAARAIKNLSWKASRSIRTRRERRVFDAARFLLDDDHKWGIL
jgi:hypothetical protein